MKLLRTTNTLSQAKDHPHRYKVQKGALPKFGKPAEAMAAGNVEGARPSGATVVGEGKFMKTATNETEKASWSGVIRRGARLLTVNPFKSPPPATVRPVVQGELSLDKVKPVRNDLSDSDLELVAVAKKPAAAPTVAKMEAPQEPVVQAGGLWQRVRRLWPQARP